MPICPSCSKRSPDDAAHCGYCGAALVPPEPKKTIFGYAPGATLNPPPPAMNPSLPATSPAGAASASSTPRRPDDATAKTQFSAAPPAPSRPGTSPAPAPLPAELLQQGLPSPAALGSGPRRPAVQVGVPAGFAVQTAPRREPSTDQNAFPATILATGSELMGQADPPAAASGNVPSAVAPAAADNVPSTIVRPASPVDGSAGATGAARPGAAPRGDVSRPVLASETLAEDLAPAAPAKALMRVLLVLGGVLLLAVFFSPWAEAGGKLLFRWKALDGLSGLKLLVPIYPLAGGVLFLAAGLLPIPYLARAITAALLALVPIGLLISASTDWRAAGLLATSAVMAAGLLHRYWYRGSIVARVVVGAGATFILASLLVPTSGGVPLIEAFEGLSDGSPDLLLQLYPVVLLLVALLSLLAFQSKDSTGLAQLWAIGLLLYLPLESCLRAGMTISMTGFAIEDLQPVYHGLSLLAYLTLSALGLSQVLAAASRSSGRS